MRGQAEEDHHGATSRERDRRRRRRARARRLDRPIDTPVGHVSHKGGRRPSPSLMAPERCDVHDHYATRDGPKPPDDMRAPRGAIVPSPTTTTLEVRHVTQNQVSARQTTAIRFDERHGVVQVDRGLDPRWTRRRRHGDGVRRLHRVG